MAAAGLYLDRAKRLWQRFAILTPGSTHLRPAPNRYAPCPSINSLAHHGLPTHAQVARNAIAGI